MKQYLLNTKLVYTVPKPFIVVFLLAPLFYWLSRSIQQCLHTPAWCSIFATWHISKWDALLSLEVWKSPWRSVLPKHSLHQWYSCTIGWGCFFNDVGTITQIKPEHVFLSHVEHWIFRLLMMLFTWSTTSSCSRSFFWVLASLTLWLFGLPVTIVPLSKHISDCPCNCKGKVSHFSPFVTQRLSKSMITHVFYSSAEEEMKRWFFGRGANTVQSS